jgi:hypothetical protein
MGDDPEPKPPFVVSASPGMNHLINTADRCPQCSGTNFTVRDYSLLWHDGEVWCLDCNVFVRSYDAG